MQKLQSMGVTTIFDLRSASEGLKDVHAIIESDGSRIERISAPIFAEDDDNEDRDVQRKLKDSQARNGTHPSSAYKQCAANMHSGLDVSELLVVLWYLTFDMTS